MRRYLVNTVSAATPVRIPEPEALGVEALQQEMALETTPYLGALVWATGLDARGAGERLLGNLRTSRIWVKTRRFMRLATQLAWSFGL